MERLIEQIKKVDDTKRQGSIKGVCFVRKEANNKLSYILVESPKPLKK